MDVARFLGGHAPFDTLDTDRLERIAASVRIEFFPAGTVILQEAGAPAEYLYVIRAGSVELIDEGRLLDLAGEGEAFGYLSLLAGSGPTATIRAAEDTIVYLIERSVAEEVLGTPRGLGFVTGAVRRQILSIHEVRAAERADARFMPVGSLIRRRPVTCEPGTSVRDAAALMAAERVSSLLIPKDGRWGILTDRDLRGRVLATGLGPEHPVTDVMSFPATTVLASTMAHELLSLMLEQGFHHFPVVDDHGELLGVVTDTDLMVLERQSPVALKSAIERAVDDEEVAAAGRDLSRVVLALVDAHNDPIDVGHVVAVTIDALTRRLIDLAIRDQGPPPVPWAWLSLGSIARHEAALHTDQDHALAYDPGDLREADVDPYFAELARRVTAGLAAADIPRCKGGAMAENDGLRHSVRGWVRQFGAWMNDPGLQGSIFTSIVFDYRRVAGPLDVEGPLDEVIRSAPYHPVFVRHMSRRALDLHPPTGFFRDLVVEAEGEHAGKLDVKHGGITLITNLARAYAIAAGVAEERTLVRLRAAADAGRIAADTREGLEEAFRVLWRTRLDHQVANVRAGLEPDDFVDPTTIGPLSRRELKESFRIIARAQKLLASDLGVRPP